MFIIYHDISEVFSHIINIKNQIIKTHRRRRRVTIGSRRRGACGAAHRLELALRGAELLFEADHLCPVIEELVHFGICFDRFGATNEPAPQKMHIQNNNH